MRNFRNGGKGYIPVINFGALGLELDLATGKRSLFSVQQVPEILKAIIYLAIDHMHASAINCVHLHCIPFPGRFLIVNIHPAMGILR